MQQKKQYTIDLLKNKHNFISQLNKKCIENSKQKKQFQYDNKMVCTKDTYKDQSSSQIKQRNWKQFQIELQNDLNYFKLKKGQQIGQIAFQSQISIQKIMKRIKTKLQNEILELIQKNVQRCQIKQDQSAQKKNRSPKQLGSTIQHTFTPKTIQTPGFQFQSEGAKQINQFSIKSNEFTLGHKQISTVYQKKCQLSKQQTVSQFNLATIRNPTSKKIKDKIMNNRKNMEIYL